MPEDSPPPSTAQRVVGMILLVLGILLTVGSGLCTSIGVITMIGDGMTGLVIFVGSWFFVPGALMWWGGLKLRRGQKPPDATEGSNG